MAHADSEGLNRRQLEIRCAWRPGLLSGDIVVGDARENLRDLPISITPVPVTEEHFIGSQTTSESNRQGEEPLVGQLTYWPPVRTSDGVVNDKTGAVTGWFVLGHQNYEDAWRRLSSTPPPEFVIGLSMLFEDKGEAFEGNAWDGTTPLRVTEGKLVFTINSVGTREAVTDADAIREGSNQRAADMLKGLSNIVGDMRKRLDWILLLLFVGLALLVFHR